MVFDGKHDNIYDDLKRDASKEKYHYISSEAHHAWSETCSIFGQRVENAKKSELDLEQWAKFSTPFMSWINCWSNDCIG